MEAKAYRVGTHRTATPQETLSRIQPLLKSMGITRVANVTGLDRVGIPVYNSCRPNSYSISVSQGKGSELLAAKVSAIMESVETFHAEIIDLPKQFGSVNELQDQLSLGFVDEMSRSGRKELNADDGIFWVKGENLFERKPCWLPLELVSTDYRLPFIEGNGFFSANTNGLASGNSINEAICHAIYEVIERDAEALWYHLPEKLQAATGVDVNSIKDENCLWLLDQFKAAGIEARIWDISSDVELPCFTCLVMGDESDWADPEFGTGCHASKEVALARALSEAAQARATFIAGSRDDVGLSEYQSNQRKKRREQGLKQMQTFKPDRDFHQLTTYNNKHIDEDLELCFKMLKNIDIKQVITVDLTKPEYGLSVVKVVIPGLEGAYGHWNGDYVAGKRVQKLMDY